MKTLNKQEIYINEIFFASREEIYLMGFLLHDGKFHETQYVIERKDLQLLLSANMNGIELLWRIEELFVSAHQVPAEINLLSLFGMTQLFEAREIVLEVAMMQVEGAQIKPVDGYGVLFVEKVMPKFNRA